MREQNQLDAAGLCARGGGAERAAAGAGASVPTWTAGVDEVGRGPLAGPVVAAAVVLDPAQVPDGLRDSKRLSARRREQLAEIIRDQAVAWCVARVDVPEIDRINVLRASLLAMARALRCLAIVPGHVQVDGRDLPDLPAKVSTAEAIVGGDASVPAISAASILAKVWRDAHMSELHRLYPHYGFERHKGYPTREHLQALRAYGPCVQHRRSFAPVADAVDAAMKASRKRMPGAASTRLDEV
jgi:ribonuclease HII